MSSTRFPIPMCIKCKCMVAIIDEHGLCYCCGKLEKFANSFLDQPMPCGHMRRDYEDGPSDDRSFDLVCNKCGQKVANAIP